ncbi:MAG TPA: uracil phosphoribosyltransferase [Flavobacterium sp.]|nr:uracil phosphoribosyltransferase [Flavobacterium sp.]
MKAFFEAIQSLFVDFLFKPYDWFRALELTNWGLANIVNWIFIIICSGAMVYWVKQLNIFKSKGEDKDNTTAHSFLD